MLMFIRATALELTGHPGLLELPVHTILLKLTERTGLRASAGRTDLLELTGRIDLGTSGLLELLESTRRAGLQG